MPEPIYIIAGQSNAGSLLATSFYDYISGSQNGAIVSGYWQGATSLSPDSAENDWYPVEDGLSTTGELYNGLIGHLGTLLTENPDSYLAGIIWVQGEADTRTSAAGLTYESNMRALIDGLRLEFGTSFEFLDIALSLHPETVELRDYWSTVRDAQLALASSEAGITVVDPDILIEQMDFGDTIFRDTVHYSYEFSDALLRYAFSQFEHATPFDAYAPIFGTADDDLISGTSLSDHIRGLGGNDQVEGGEGDDLLFGASGSDVLLGGDGNDLIDGGIGADQMAGGQGNDTYVIDDGADSIVEAAGAGTDTVMTAFSLSLAVNLENLHAAPGVGGLVLTGNQSANEIIGGSGDDTLDGGNGADVLRGNAGNDLLLGGAGADTLDGGLGSNTLIGGAGADRYAIRSADDVIQESAAGGYDSVNLFVSYILSAGVELERVFLHEGAGAISFTGNEFGNLVYGNSFANTIHGWAGDDQMIGGAGDDILISGEGLDTIDAGDGDDTIHSLLDGDTVIGGNGTDRLILSVSQSEARIFTADTPRGLVIAFAQDGQLVLTNLSEIEFIEFTDATISVLETEFFPNQGPVFSTPGTVVASEGNNDTGLIVAADDPEGAFINYTIAEEGDGMLFELSVDGTLNFIDAPDFEAPGDADGDNAYDVVLIASDGISDTRLNVTVTVADIDEAPIFPGPVALTINEGETGTGFVPMASDPENRALSYAIAAEGDGALFEFDLDGRLRFIVAPDFEAPGDAGGDNAYDLVLIASDGINETRINVAVTVADLDEAPVFHGPAALTIDEGETGTGFVPMATDPERRALSYAIAAEGDGALFELDLDGTLRFITAPDFEAPGDADGDNAYDVVLIASDGVSDTRLAIAITVADINPEYTYAADGTLIAKTVHDVADAAEWQIATTFYFENGRVSGRHLLLDNHDAKEFHYDQSGTMINQILIDESDRRAWDNIVISYDTAKTVISRETVMDDGDITTNYYDAGGWMAERIRFDGDNDVSWLRDIYQYEADGSVIGRQLHFDSGRWDSFTYDSEGVLLERIQHNLDGSTVIL